MADDAWYYCLRHSSVEPYNGCPADVRLGPYATREEAAEALHHAQERNEEWDNDPRFNDPDEDEGDDEWGDSAFDTFKP